MDLLITLIGNAAVDPIFRERFLKNPVDVLDHYGFHLTKGEFEMLMEVFAKLTPEQKRQLEEAFAALERELYANLKCGHPCSWSIYPPAEFRDGWRKAA